MLGRIRQATSDFDFTALLSGTKPETPATDIPADPLPRQAAPLDIPFDIAFEAPPASPTGEKPAAPEPVAYNPFLIEEPAPPVAPPPVETAPDHLQQRAAEDTRGPIQFDQSFMRSQPALPAARPLAAPVAPPAQPAARPAPVVYARPASPLPAAMTRLTLFFLAILIGGAVGGGLGALLEWFTPIRILSVPARYAVVKPSAAGTSPMSSSTALARRDGSRGRGRSRAAAKPAPAKPAPAAAVVKTSVAPKALEAYRRYLLIPVGLLLLAGLFWICGGPEALGEFEDVGYWGAAAASLALAVLCGLLAVMVTMDLRAANAPPSAPRSIGRGLSARNSA